MLHSFNLFIDAYHKIQQPDGCLTSRPNPTQPDQIIIRHNYSCCGTLFYNPYRRDRTESTPAVRQSVTGSSMHLTVVKYAAPHRSIGESDAARDELKSSQISCFLWYTKHKNVFASGFFRGLDYNSTSPSMYWQLHVHVSSIFFSSIQRGLHRTKRTIEKNWFLM